MSQERVVTHYDNLKVARNAPTEVIRAAYRALRVTVQIANFVQVKRTATSNFKRGGQQLGWVQAGQAHTRAQVRLGVVRQGKTAFVYGAIHADSGQYIVQRFAGTYVHQHRTSSH